MSAPSLERALPHSAETERAVLAAVLLTPPSHDPASGARRI